MFPTRVGMDRMSSRTRAWPSCVPHARGDGPPEQGVQTWAFGCSPRAWGWTGGRTVMGLFTNVFPTRVGMDRAAASSG